MPNSKNNNSENKKVEASKDTRFKPGESGNPEGRPRKDRSMAVFPRDFREVVLEQANEEIAITQNGRKIRKKAFEVALHRLYLLAMSGNHAALKQYISIVYGAMMDAETWQVRFMQMLEPEEFGPPDNADDDIAVHDSIHKTLNKIPLWRQRKNTGRRRRK